MPHFVNISTLTLPASIQYSLSSDICHELAQRFDFDKILSLSGSFQLTPEKDYFILKGTYKGEVVLHGKNVLAEESITLFLLTSQTQEALFDITDDFEVLDNNQTFDLEEILGQYLYLEVCDFE